MFRAVAVWFPIALLMACSPAATSDDAAVNPQPDGGVDASTAQDAAPDASTSDASTSDASTPDASAADASVPTGIQLLQDHRFLNGFNTYPISPSTTPIGTLIPPTSNGNPVWQLAEWHTQQLLANVPPTITADGAQWANSYKSVVVDDGFLEFALNAESEWGGVYRLPGEQWPHLLIAQVIFDSAAPSSNTPIHSYASVTMSLQIERVYTNHIQESGYDPSLHACQFLMFITLQNRNQSHPDYGNYIWFGLPFYDDRYATLSESVDVDIGTGHYMFRMASVNFMPASLHNQTVVNISVDLLPYMQAAVEDAILQGIFISPNLDDYFIGGMNLGFEVPGRSIATFRIRNFSILATL